MPADRRGDQAGRLLIEAAKKTLSTDFILEPDAMRILSEAGISVPPHAVAATAEEAAAAARKLGFPVCIKVVSRDIIHKSDVGGVKLNIRDEAMAKDAFFALEKICQGKAFSGVIIYPMLPKGDELIMGLTRDPQFGPVVAFGMGGVFTEVFRDVALRVAPLSHDEALGMIQSVKAYKILCGAKRRREKGYLRALRHARCGYPNSCSFTMTSPK